MPFDMKHGTVYWVPQKVMDRAKKRASKKNQFASESVREEDENDRTKAESHIHARAYDMTTSASNTRPKASSTDSEVSSIHSTESSMQSVETQAASTEINASAIELEASSIYPTESSMQCVETKASSTETKASPIAAGAPSTSPNESKLPCVETQELVVAVYFKSRFFGPNVVQEMIRRRVCETPDPDIDHKVDSVMYNAKMCEEGKLYYDRVDEWLNKQMSYKELLDLTKIDDYIQQLMDKSVGALVLYARSNDLPTIRDIYWIREIWR